MQSALDPHGPVAEQIAATWWLMLGGALAVLLLVMALLLYAVFAPPERRPALDHGWFIAIGGIALPTVVLTALLIHGTAVGRALVAPADAPLRVEVIGHQWRWEVRYPAADGAPARVLENELKLPADTPVEITLQSADVIHSLWIPMLAGKVDLVPGRTNVLRLRATRTGRMRGQCAEFCGELHAHMSIAVEVLPAEAFAAWRAAEDAAR